MSNRIARKVPPCMFCGGQSIIWSFVGKTAGMYWCDDPECDAAVHRLTERR